MNKRFFLLILISLSVSSLFAQVGVNTENPNVLTELDVRNIVNGSDTIPKGIMIPRMTEVQRNEIDVSNVTTANSLMIYNIDEDCYNYYSKSNLEWQSLCGKMGKAHFDMDCDLVTVVGQYGDKVALNASNYLKVTVNVTRIGSYSISAVSTPDNGYFFEASGTFFTTGKITLTIQGTGEPVNHTQGANLIDPSDDTPNLFMLTSNGGGSDCSFKVNVRSTAARPKFTMDCAATVVEGMYFEDQALSSTPNPYNGQSHRIKVTLKNIPSTSYGAVAVLETNTVDGISFKGEAVLISSTQEVYLTGTGVPRGLTDKIMTIISNSESSTASCTATVRMLIPRKRLMTLGNTTVPYYYNAGLVDTRNPPNNLNTLLTDKNNFGYNQWSILRFQGFNNVSTSLLSNFIPTSPNSWVDDDRDIVALQTSTWQNMSAEKLESFLKGTNGVSKVDIFMIGYNTDFYRNANAADAAKCAKLVDFVKSGGILMICSEETASNANFLNLLFNNPNPAITSVIGAGAGSNYTLGFNNSNMPADMKPYYCKDDDPILRGPFDDIVGRNWGEDASNTYFVNNLPLDEVVIYSGAREIGNTLRPANGVTIFRHREYPFVFIGDGGFNSSEARSYANVNSGVCPFVLTNKTINGKTYTNYPTFRLNFGGSGNRVYNTIFTANAFAWCIMKAEELRKLNNQ
ncbi:hypothetical protein CLV62_101297 [Dysgonomonas alginatilytica]|uniref:Uncharacterized protein n=1 Tax=Dysgonomonas alginatilytica TaxID=1605892 RepID=A0A2V3PWR3_9BACT|nr:hypothetical protein [Dysgonomonas alginatilytica]PXV69028.1 hypothetical protein CLV62_101297 [Dysgonomonas alginatilytica]